MPDEMAVERGHGHGDPVDPVGLRSSIGQIGARPKVSRPMEGEPAVLRREALGDDLERGEAEGLP
jgi:hypothetical protein